MAYTIDYKKVVDTARILSDRTNKDITPGMVYDEIQDHAGDTEEPCCDYETWLNNSYPSVIALWLQRLHTLGILIRQ